MNSTDIAHLARMADNCGSITELPCLRNAEDPFTRAARINGVRAMAEKLGADASADPAPEAGLRARLNMQRRNAERFAWLRAEILLALALWGAGVWAAFYWFL